MNRIVEKNSLNYQKRNRRHRKWRMFLTGGAGVIVFATVYMLILPAITMEKYYCGYEEHLHSTDCYTDGELTCGYQEHVHTDECREELLDGAAPALTNQENSQMQASEDAPAGLSIDSIEIAEDPGLVPVEPYGNSQGTEEANVPDNGSYVIGDAFEEESESESENEFESELTMKPEFETEIDSELVEDSEPESEVERESELQTELDSETELKSETETESETEVESGTEKESATEIEFETEKTLEKESETEAETDSELDTESASEKENESETEQESDFLTGDKAEFETDIESESSTEFDTEIESETGAESELETESETELDTEPESEWETESDFETEIETETESESEIETETETEIESETETETEIESETETETETESETETEAEYTSGQLSVSGPDYKVTINYSEEAKIPADAYVTVEEITPEANEALYRQYLQASCEALQVTEEELTRMPGQARFPATSGITSAANRGACERECVLKLPTRHHLRTQIRKM